MVAKMNSKDRDTNIYYLKTEHRNNQISNFIQISWRLDRVIQKDIWNFSSDLKVLRLIGKLFQTFYAAKLMFRENTFLFAKSSL